MNIAIFDPKGETARLLKNHGIQFKPVDASADLTGYGLLIIGKDALAVVIGLPIFLLGVCLWIWSMRRFFFGVQVVFKKDAVNKTTEYQRMQYKFTSDDARTGCAWAHAGFLGGWIAVWLLIIF